MGHELALNYITWWGRFLVVLQQIVVLELVSVQNKVCVLPTVTNPTASYGEFNQQTLS